MSTNQNPPRTPLLRPPVIPGQWAKYGRYLAGVCSGLGSHLGINPSVIRLTFLLMAPVTGFFYVFLWLFVPSGNPWAPAPDSRPVAATRLTRSLADTYDAAVTPTTSVLFTPRNLRWILPLFAGVIMIFFATIIIWKGPTVLLDFGWVLPLGFSVGGIAVIWIQIPKFDARAGVPARKRGILGIILGMGLVAIGVVWMLPTDAAWMNVRGSLVTLLVIGVLVLVMAPLGVRFFRQLAEYQAEEARQSERADIAAHLHDGVLQTLALIRARADDPQQVSRLARAQERQLRQWLYQDRSSPSESLAQEIRQQTEEVEDLYAVAIELVTVGDATPTPATAGFVAAAREALNNAAVHGREPITVYFEATPTHVEAYISDRGEGFDPANIPADRHGVRDSIINRMERYGGGAVFTKRANGMEVKLFQDIPKGDKPND